MTINTHFMPIKLWLLLTFILFISCSQKVQKTDESSTDYPIVPAHFPPLNFPEDNSYSKAKASLGKKLFSEKLLSKDSSLSCTSCHLPAHGLSSPTPISLGFGKETGFRNVMLNANIAYRKELDWDGRETKIERIPIGSLVLKSVFNSDTNEIERRLSGNPEYVGLFEAAFGDSAKPAAYLIVRALATFLRTLISGNSAYDKYILGDKNALSLKQIRGMNLFFSDRANCSKCHSGIFFTDGKYHNTGTTTHYFDRGRYYFTKNDKDRGKFLTPSLRNVEVTAPYTHDGEMFTLEQIIENYNIGGKPFITKDTLLKPLNLTPQEKTDLISFLKALTDWDYINSLKELK